MSCDFLNNKTILITGGYGFIGSNFIHLIQQKSPTVNVINVDCMTYAANKSNLTGVDESRYTWYNTDIVDKDSLRQIFKQFKIDYVVNFAAESHVDRSITGPDKFITTNVLGSLNMVELAREYQIERYLQVSTDEVYGSLGETGYFTENTSLDPSSPYSASKAAADLIVLANNHTYNQNVVITRCSNNYGPRQNVEKLIPLMITKALNNEPLPVYGKGTNIRDWIHVIDHCEGILAALRYGRPGHVYNFGGNCEKRNIDVVTTILTQLNKSESLIKYVTDRLGHDYRYAIDFTKSLDELNWTPTYSWDTGIKETIDWYINQ